MSSFLNKHYYESEKGNLNLKNIRESFFGHYLCTNGGFNESNHNTKKWIHHWKESGWKC